MHAKIINKALHLRLLVLFRSWCLAIFADLALLILCQRINSRWQHTEICQTT